MRASKSSLPQHGVIEPDFQHTPQQPYRRAHRSLIFHEWKNPAWAALVLAPRPRGRAGHVHSAAGKGLRWSPCASAPSGPAATEAARVGKRSGRSSAKSGADSCRVPAGNTDCPAARRHCPTFLLSPSRFCQKTCQNVPSLPRRRHQRLKAVYEMHPRS